MFIFSHITGIYPGISPTEVGKAVSVSRQMISYIVNCRSNPSGKLQRRLEQFFGIPASELLTESERQQ
ncbi:helix-turn-helix transcriptional regulator [Desulfoscipio gibsoniae]